MALVDITLSFYYILLDTDRTITLDSFVIWLRSLMTRRLKLLSQLPERIQTLSIAWFRDLHLSQRVTQVSRLHQETLKLKFFISFPLRGIYLNVQYALELNSTWGKVYATSHDRWLIDLFPRAPFSRCYKSVIQRCLDS